MWIWRHSDRFGRARCLSACIGLGQPEWQAVLAATLLAEHPERFPPTTTTSNPVRHNKNDNGNTHAETEDVLNTPENGHDRACSFCFSTVVLVEVFKPAVRFRLPREQIENLHHRLVKLLCLALGIIRTEANKGEPLPGMRH